MIKATIYSDPACPWAYSESPALRVIEWRYGDQLDWELVLIGLTEDASQYATRGYTPLRGALGQLSFRRYGMPFAPEPKARLSATARACRAVVAARLANPGSEWAAFRAIQLANFTTPLVLDDDPSVCAVVAAGTGIAANELQGMLDSPEVTEAYERDRAETRSAEGSAAHRQGKTATSPEGLERYTASSVIFELGGARLVAGGFQPIEAYDVIVTNLDPAIERRAAPDDPAAIIERFPDGLTTQEVAAILAKSNDRPDRAAAELMLLDLVFAGEAERVGLGDDAVWTAAGNSETVRAIIDAAGSLQVVGS
jgi:predicted DsbA family dithiol-disulfide isomerase